MKILKLLIRMFTQENFLALNKSCLKILVTIFFISLGLNAFAEDWYISNSAGMILEKTFSRAALREPYALNIEVYPQNQIPAEVAAYIDTSIRVPELFSAELHTLYENSEVKNRRWILRYAKGNTWIVISVNDAGTEELAITGFAEYYNESGLLAQEDTFLGTDVLSNRYTYRDEVLQKSEAWQNSETHLWSDEYHYARSGSLRSIERTFYSAETEDRIRLSNFAALSLDIQNASIINSLPTISSDFISDIINVTNKNIERMTDDQGRIISEIHKDEEGNIIGELMNVWSAERLASMSWNAENDARRIEYEYDSNNERIIERNYRNNILERLVRTEEDREVEELYLQGRLSLRAVWKDGQKISEEYFQQNARRNR
ncbi:MAG: hypothetical protein LBV20_02565 [Treponema sp.]|jgi:antitoxin component YwqK of YwqJK toxin-antitoxin module|nr:hypothetical protein [Treponema sp.]